MMGPDTKLAHYRLVERIGEGGMGVVWRALDTQLEREVAIKVLSETFSSESERLARFQREAKLLASINHANVATVYGLHEQNGVHFLAMELIPGQDLVRRLAEQPPTVGEALSIARQIAAALEATHERGVIHRDLKPANVYLTPNGGVKVLDFGIARDVESWSEGDSGDATGPHDPTLPGTILGTVSYMSPEQARGKPLDARADLWSFGCVLYQMLCGRPAFEGETRWDKLAAVLREEPDWSRLPAGAPEGVVALLRACLQKEREQRPANATEVRRVLDGAIGVSTGSGPVETTGETVVGRHPATSSRGAWMIGLPVAAAVLLLAVVLLRPSGRDAEASAAPARSVAVLPFETMGGDAEAAAFTAGIHDDILNQVARIGDLKVISRTSVMEYRDTSKNVRQIGKELGVAAVLEGMVRRAEDQVRINVQLVDAATEESLWAESYNRELSLEGIFEIQADIAQRVASALQATLSADERRRMEAPPTDNLEAYLAYQRGWELVSRPGEMEQDLVAALAHFEDAIALDPTFALAHAGLSRAARDYYWLGGGGDVDLRRAVRAAERAMELDPELPEAHLELGACFYVQRDYDRALEHYRIAERGLAGDSEFVRSLAYLIRRRGDWEEALRYLQRAATLDPLEPETWHEAALTLMTLRRYDEAEPYYRRALQLAPDYAWARTYRVMNRVIRDGTRDAAERALEVYRAVPAGPWKWITGWQMLLYNRDYDGAVEFLAEVDRVSGQSYDYPTQLLAGWVHRLQGRGQEAARQFDAARAILELDVRSRPQDARLRMALGLAYAGLGRASQALEEGRRAVDLMPVEQDALVGGWLLQDLGWICVMTGELDAAVETFDRLLSIPSFWSVELLQLDPRISPLRDHAGFARLAERHRRRS